MTAFEIAVACGKACRRASVESMTDQLTAYLAIKDYHLRAEEVSAEIRGPVWGSDGRFKPIIGKAAVMICFNRFALELSGRDPTANRVLEVARTLLRDENHG